MVEGPDTSKAEDISTAKNDISKKKGKEEKQPTKVIIRKLPGSMTEESFLECISPLFEHDYFYYVQNENPSFGDHNYSRAYINFINVEDVFTFTMKFDDYVFIDENGQEYPVIVEYAPIQRIPKNRGSRKSDSYCNTIENDSDYKEFLQQLEAEEQEHKTNPATEHYFDLANDETEEKVIITPLIEYLTSRKNEYIKYKEEKKEERRRRDIERRKLKDESRRIKKENKEAKAKIIEKSKEDKKTISDSKIFEEITSPSIRIRGKSYQEERQRDLARRKMEEKAPKTDDNKENSKTLEKSGEDCDKKNDKVLRSEEEYSKKYSEDRKSGFYREKDDKKYTFAVKKREFVGGYDHDKYKTGKIYYYDDYKRGNTSYQKSTFAGGKYSKNKDYYEEKNSKRYENKSKKYEHDYKERKNKEKDVEKRSTDKDIKIEVKDKIKNEEEEINELTNKEVDDCSDNTSEVESNKHKDSKKERKDIDSDPRLERRIKNKDRPAMEIYRPGMGKFSRQRLERNKSSDGKECD